MRSKTRYWGRGGLALVAIGVMSAVVMLLWNAVMPALFTEVHSIDYLHAAGLLVLCQILFVGFRPLYGGWRGHRHWHGQRHELWDKWQAMTPEEHEQFRCDGPWKKRASDQQ